MSAASPVLVATRGAMVGATSTATVGRGWRQRRDQVHSAFKHAADDLGQIADKYSASPPRHTMHYARHK